MQADDERSELERLREENAHLKAAAARTDGSGPGGVWRTWVSVICLVLAGILVPVSIAGAWARVQLVSEEAFVQTFAPLAADPGVQDFVIEQTTQVILDRVDVDGVTSDLFDGLATLDLPPAALRAIGLLEGPAAEGARSLIASTVDSTVHSEAFPVVWRTALASSHRALVAAATLDDTGAIVLDSGGDLGINLGPIVDAIKERLVDRGFGLAESIPAVDTVVVVAQADGLLLLAALHAIADTVGVLLPWVALGLLVAGALLARRRSAGVLGAGLSLMLGAAALAGGLVGGAVFLRAASPGWGVPPGVMLTAFDAVVGAMRDSAVALTVLGLLVAVAGWLTGRSRAAARVGTLSSSLASGARGTLQQYGLDTGRFGAWLDRQSTLVGVLVVAGGLAALMAMRPLSLGDVVTVLAVGLGVWLVVTLVRREGTGPEASVDTGSLPAPAVEEPQAH